MSYKVVLTFVGPDARSWHEQYSSNESSLANAVLLSTDFYNARLAMSPSSVKLRSIRASDVLNPRLTLNRVTNFKGLAPLTQGLEPAGFSIVCNLKGQSGGARKLWLRGVTTNLAFVNGGDGSLVPSPTLNAYLAQLSRGLKASNWGILRLAKSPNTDALKFQVTKIDGSAANGTSVLTCTAQPPFAVGNRVILQRFSKKDLPALNGTFQILALAGNTITIPYVTPENQVLPTPGGTVKKYAFEPFSQFDGDPNIFDHFGTHSTRAGDFNSRGARRAARIRLVP